MFLAHVAYAHLNVPLPALVSEWLLQPRPAPASPQPPRLVDPERYSNATILPRVVEPDGTIVYTMNCGKPLRIPQGDLLGISGTRNKEVHILTMFIIDENDKCVFLGEKKPPMSEPHEEGHEEEYRSWLAAKDINVAGIDGKQKNPKPKPKEFYEARKVGAGIQGLADPERVERARWNEEKANIALWPPKN